MHARKFKITASNIAAVQCLPSDELMLVDSATLRATLAWRCHCQWQTSMLIKGTLVLLPAGGTQRTPRAGLAGTAGGRRRRPAHRHGRD
jgi:hypothetical protein